MLASIAPVTVDAITRTVSVRPGATWAQVDAAAQRHGLAVTGARVSSEPVSLAGDGWLVRSMGLVSDNLVGARTPGGEEAGDDLLRALLASGRLDGAGAVTLRLRPFGRDVDGGVRTYPLERAADVLAAYREALRDAPEAVGGGLVLTRRDVRVVVLGEAPDLRAAGPAASDTVGATTYPQVQRLLDPLAHAASRWSEHAGLMDDLPDGAIATLALLATELATAAGHIVLQPLGGAFASPGADPPFGHRDARWSYRIAAGWDDPRADAAEIAWSRAAAAELEPYDRGVALPGLTSRSAVLAA